MSVTLFVTGTLIIQHPAIKHIKNKIQTLSCQLYYKFLYTH